MRSAPVLSALLSVAACGPQLGPDLSLTSTLEMPIGAPCPADGTGGAEFTSDADELRVTITGPGIETPVEATGKLGKLTVEAVPEGADRVLGAFGLVSGLPAWRGVARGITVKKDEDTAVSVLLSKVADFTCARSPDPSARELHSATTLKDGRVLLVGGATSSTSGPCAGCTTFTATSSASIYDPKTGKITATGQMNVPRLFHVAVLLDDGRVLVAGGARSIVSHPVDAQFLFPLAPPTADDVLGSIEVFDPNTGAFSAVGDDPQGRRLFAAGAPTLDGGAIITGGIPGPGGAKHDLSNAVTSTTRCSGTPLVCSAGPSMARPRAGHAAFRIAPDGVFLAGGSVDTTAVGLPGYQMERWNGNDIAFVLIDVEQMFLTENVFFPLVAQYVPFRVLMAGGLTQDAAGAFALADDGAGRSPVVIYDATHGEVGGIVKAAVPQDPGTKMHLQTKRWLGAAAPLPGNTRAVFAGGFTTLALSASADVELFDENTISVSPISVGGQPRTMRQPRGGVAAAAIGDGTVIFSGGHTDAPTTTVEVFADPKLPPGVAP
jgi:hypothetical protein